MTYSAGQPLATQGDDGFGGGTMARVLEQIVGRMRPAGTVAELVLAEQSTRYMDGKRPMHEPERTEALEQLVNESFMLTLRKDLAPHIAGQYRMHKSKKEPGIPLVIEYGEKIDRDTNSTVPVQRYELFPGRPLSVPFVVANWCLNNHVYGPLVEEYDPDEEPESVQ